MNTKYRNKSIMEKLMQQMYALTVTIFLVIALLGGLTAPAVGADKTLAVQSGQTL